MPLSLALVFHFNQHLSEFARAASFVCYRGLLRALRRHPALKVNLHVSGTLIHALGWLDPEPLELIRAGVADGQFELLGSTYAQNVAYATDDGDNRRQVELHREVIRQTFGVSPISFWNPERCWRQSLVPLIANAGYRITLVEDHILRDSGAAQPRVFATRHAGRELGVVVDDETLKHKFNFAAWFGRPQQAIDHLRRIGDHPARDTFCVAYAEDAEAMGLWGWHFGVIPHQAWANLDALLAQLEGLDWLSLIHLSGAPPPSADLTPIADGSAAWMDGSLRAPGAPYHEDGYRNWLDFIARSPKVAHYASLYAEARSCLKVTINARQTLPADPKGGFAQPQPPGPNIDRLQRLAVHTLCANQYEFGCIGVGGIGYPGWEGARAVFAIARAAELAAQPRAGVWREDVNRDGRDEIVLCDGRQFAVASPEDARLLYWFDLAEGVQWVGNQLAVPAGSAGVPHPARWLPDSFEPDVSPFEAFRVEEASPTRLARFLPAWIWRDEPSTLPLYAREMRLHESVMPLPVRRCAFAEAITLDGNFQPATHPGDTRLNGDTATVTRALDAAIVLVKQLRLNEGELCADYTLDNRSRDRRTAQLRIANELCPDYVDALPGGRASLAFAEDGPRQGVGNARTGRAVLVSTSHPPDCFERSERRESLFALEVTPVFDLDLAPQARQSFSVRLIAMPFKPG